MPHMLKLEISLSAIAHNVRAVRRMIGPQVLLCGVVKSNAYGHGIDLVWREIAAQADWLGVASEDEAIALRELGYDGPLLMLFCARSCGVGTEAVALLAELIRRNVTLTVTDLADVALIKLAAAQAGMDAALHIEIDSGMTRSGAAPRQVNTILDATREASTIRLDGIYTHFATADEEDDTSLRGQMEEVNRCISSLPLSCYKLMHYANSAAAARVPDTHRDMVRVGLLLYGYWPSRHVAAGVELKPAMRLLSTIMQIHEVPKGTRVGYGLTYVCQRPSRIGLAAGGYGDGYLRALSNRGVVRIGDAIAPVAGRVSMDQITIDLTDLPNTMVGDTVELVANDPQAPNSADGLAEKAGTISYEILTQLGSCRIERVVIRD